MKKITTTEEARSILKNANRNSAATDCDVAVIFRKDLMAGYVVPQVVYMSDHIQLLNFVTSEITSMDSLDVPHLVYINGQLEHSRKADQLF